MASRRIRTRQVAEAQEEEERTDRLLLRSTVAGAEYTMWPKARISRHLRIVVGRALEARGEGMELRQELQQQQQEGGEEEPQQHQ